jgi:hypothetical protein
MINPILRNVFAMAAFFIIYYSNIKETVICLDLNHRQYLQRIYNTSNTTIDRDQ